MEEFGIRLIAEHAGRHYHFASIKFKTKKELIYVFEFFDKRKIFKFHDFETGIKRIQRQVDHISFHCDGGVHIYYKNIKGKGERMDKNKLKDNPFSIPTSQYVPLLIHSSNFDVSRINIQKEVKDIDGQDIIFDVSVLNKFSIVLFSLGSEVNYKKMLASHGFEKIFDISKSKLVCEPFIDHSEGDVSRIALGQFTDTNILLAYTEKTIPVPDKMIDFEKKRGIEIGSSMPFSVLPSEDKIINRLK